jgi:translation initiation factor IF-2
LAEEDFSLRTKRILEELLYCRITTSEVKFQESLSKISSQLNLAIPTARIMNVKIPVFEIKELKIVLKADVRGSLEAIKEAIRKLNITFQRTIYPMK